MDAENKIYSKLVENRSGLSQKMADVQFERQPELKKQYGEKGIRKTYDDALHNIDNLADAVLFESPKMFSDYIHWLGEVLRAYKVPVDHLAQHLEIMREVLSDFFDNDADMQIIDDFINAALSALQENRQRVFSFINPDAKHADIARKYLEHILATEREKAMQLILDTVINEEATVEEIYLDVFQPVQREIGYLWQNNKISVALEHYGTVVTQLVMSQLYPQIFSTNKIGRTLVATSVGGELHEIGIRMVADLFELHGWNTYYLGANTPMNSLMKMVDEEGADVLALSATMTSHLKVMQDIIKNIRNTSFGNIIIMAGGYPFIQYEGLWEKIGADGFAPDAESAVHKAHELLST